MPIFNCGNTKKGQSGLNCTPKIGHNFWRCSFFMSKYSKEVKEKAIYLSEKGWNSFSIAKELGIPESTVNGWLLKFKINHNINRKAKLYCSKA